MINPLPERKKKEGRQIQASASILWPSGIFTGHTSQSSNPKACKSLHARPSQPQHERAVLRLKRLIIFDDRKQKKMAAANTVSAMKSTVPG